MKESRKDMLRIILSMLIFGTIGLLRKSIPLPSSVVAFSRALIGTLFLLSVLAFRRQKPAVSAIRANLLPLLISGALLGFNWIALFEAYRYTTVSVATLCYYMAPVLIMLVSPVVLHERLTVKKAICAAAALAGMVLVSGVLDTGINGAQGILLGLLAACMYATIVLLNKRMHDISAMDRTICQLGIASVAMLPYVLLTEDVAALQPDTLGVVLLLVAGVVYTGIAYTLYFSAMKGVTAQTAALLSYIDPVVAVLLSVTVLHEPASILTIVGAVVVIGAMILSEKE